MLRPQITGKIVKIESDSEYEGKIYDQIVSLELQNGSIICVEDHNMVINKEMVGNLKKVTITAFLPYIEKTDKQEFLIRSNIKSIKMK